MDQNKATLSPLAMSVVERLAGGSFALQELQDLSAKVGTSSDEGPDDKFQVIFKEEIDEDFVPREYLETLKALVNAKEIPEPGCEELVQLKDTLSSDRIELSVSRIILASLGLVAPERLEALKRSLIELSRYFLEVGDFRSLEDMYDKLSGTRFEAGHTAILLKDEVLGVFETPDFVAEVLNGLDIWGKEKYREIGSLIHRVGKPFVEPLLDRLAEEENRTLRRYCLDQMLKMGGLAKEAVLARMGDERWYFIRNLVMILQHTGDPDVPGFLRGVADFPHPKVRQIVVETYLRFQDPEGDRLLLRDLASDDGELRMQAIQQAVKSRDSRVHEALMGILRKKGVSPERFSEKKAAINALAMIGNKVTLPALEKMLAARYFFRPSLQYLLKKEIISTLGKYRDPSAVILLRKIAESSDRRLSGLASDVIKAMEGADE